MSFGTPDRTLLNTQSQSFQAFAALLLGLAVGTVFVAAMMKNPLIALVFVAALPGALVMVLKPDWGVCLFLLLILVLEEFPSGIGHSIERSQRTRFYSQSLGIPGLYSTDVLLFGTLGILLAYRAIQGKRLIYVDAIGIGLAAMMGFLALGAVLSMLSGNPFEAAQYFEDSGTGYQVNERGATLIAFFQYKIFLYLLLAYILGTLFLDSPRKIQMVLVVVLVSGIINVFVGIGRLALQPEIVKQMIPLFYHQPTSWIFALTGFYTVLAWSYGLLNHRQAVLMMILSAVLLFWILLSFRRTMWGAVALVSPLVLIYAHPRQRLRILVIGCIGLVFAAAAAFALPGLRAITGAVGGRLEETSAADTSTLYRLALFIYFARHIEELPLFGYGVTPLWNKTVSLGFFRINLENIHSLYFWWLLRMGIVGFGVAMAAITAFVAMILRFARVTRNHQYKAVAVCILIALLMLLFGGLFNPVYGEARYMILMGFMLAMITRMAQFEGINLTNLRDTAGRNASPRETRA